MKTKELILHKGRELMNQKGLEGVTLRDIAASIGKSYGNVTYHFPGKESLVSALYLEMQNDLLALGQQLRQEKNPMMALLAGPAFSFDLSLKYLFFFQDYVALIRNFPSIAASIQLGNKLRKEKLLPLLHQVQALGYLREEFSDEELDYLMELSGVMRTWFFIRMGEYPSKEKDLKRDYILYVNRLLLPWLSPEGKKKYEECMPLIK